MPRYDDEDDAAGDDECCGSTNRTSAGNTVPFGVFGALLVSLSLSLPMVSLRVLLVSVVVPLGEVGFDEVDNDAISATRSFGAWAPLVGVAVTVAVIGDNGGG